MNGQFYDYAFIARIRDAKYTQDEFAKLLGINTVTLSRLENGHNASYELIIRVCQALDIDSSKVFYSSRQVSFAT